MYFSQSAGMVLQIHAEEDENIAIIDEISDDSESADDVGEMSNTEDVEELDASQNGKLVINEVNSSPDDWVEFMNVGTDRIDVSGYEIRDNSDDHRWRFQEGSAIEAGALYVVDAKKIGFVYDDQSGSYVEGSFETAIGIGSGDSIRVYDKDGNLLDECSWTEHASVGGDAALASIGRYPDGIGAFLDFGISTKKVPGSRSGQIHAAP